MAKLHVARITTKKIRHIKYRRGESIYTYVTCKGWVNKIYYLKNNVNLVILYCKRNSGPPRLSRLDYALR